MVKVISLSEEAYTELKRHKHGSFSETVLELVKEKKKGTNYDEIRKQAGSLRSSKANWSKILEQIYAERKIRLRKWQF